MTVLRDGEPVWGEAPAQGLQAPAAQGLYDPAHEHDACGVGFVVDVKGRKSHQIMQHAIQMLRNLDHRGACGCEANTGDGAGVLIQMPHAFLKEVTRKLSVTLPAPGEFAFLDRLGFTGTAGYMLRRL